MKNLLLAGIVLVSSFAFGTTTITTISLDEAQKVATEALKEAKAQKVDTTIVILNKVGNVIVMLRDDNAKPHTLDTAEKKAFTALTFEAPTSVVSGIIKDVPKLKIGQKVRFTLANETVERIATVYLIGREIGEDRTVRIHCHLDKEDGELLPGMYLKAYVEAGTQSLTAIPNDAIVVFEGANYVFVTIPSDEKGTQHFKMIQITKGVSELGYTEIQLPKDINTESSIVINGAFDILAKMKNSEEEGGHSH